MQARIKEFVKSPVVATLIAQFVCFGVWIHEMDKRLSIHEGYIDALLLEKPLFRILSLEERLRGVEARVQLLEDKELAARTLALEERVRIAEEEINELEAVRDGRLSKGT